MWTRHHKSRIYGRLVVPVITACFMSYFIYHSIHGDYGLIASKNFEQHRQINERKLEKLVSERQALEKKVERLSDGSLMKDAVDEQARYALNLLRPDEIVIFDRNL
ncbi:FtsB family cell division protein [Martelella mediterranea]|uniref:Cell division protein FtsB n=1 Tax=Martelella mediterranea TaxID=293089 RepID=A0A4R3NTQ9_9HYPH|nr:septum formation initiator family protein [Martelella mediterranea]TCT39281.1 cell division protein FtsB [Martelella mediterranea]